MLSWSRFRLPCESGPSYKTVVILLHNCNILKVTDAKTGEERQHFYLFKHFPSYYISGLFAMTLIWHQWITEGKQQWHRASLKDIVTGAIIWEWHYNHSADMLPTLSNIKSCLYLQDGVGGRGGRRWGSLPTQLTLYSCNSVCLRPEFPSSKMVNKLWLAETFSAKCWIKVRAGRRNGGRFIENRIGSGCVSGLTDAMMTMGFEKNKAVLEDVQLRLIWR